MKVETFDFKIIAADKKTAARLGIIRTAHGDIWTPAFVPVGTQATVKSISNEDLLEIGTQVFFVNTYHIYLRPGLEVIKKMGGLHSFMGWDKPLMTDSAGFQIFSLGDVNRQRKLRLQGFDLDIPLVKIDEEGVVFRSHLDGREHVFTPEKSIAAQKALGADIVMAFDECCYYPATYEYAKQAVQRTHRWALRSLDESKKTRDSQALYGIIQGGVFEDLRRESAKFISSLPFDGIAIGGVAVGESKKEMQDVLGWVVPLLPKEKPCHVLGVGEIDDIFSLVERGIDTFDCVMPTRLGRMGHLLTREMYKIHRKWTIDIAKTESIDDPKPIDSHCRCFVCKHYSRAYLHHLFRSRELLAYHLATYHNLFFIENLMREIRSSIEDGNFLKLKKEWLL